MAEEDKIEGELNAVLRRLQRLPRPKERARIAMRAMRGLATMVGAELHVELGNNPDDLLARLEQENNYR